jgi:hypothetical protein
VKGERARPGASRFGFGFRLGLAAGWAIAPVFGLASFLRRARTFHPRGPVLHATVRPYTDAPIELRGLAERLAGPALVRFSGALWKDAEGAPDVLGCAVRLRRHDQDTVEPSEDDQDLLFATIRRPWTLPVSPFTTAVRDYLDNDYYSVSPFDAGLARPVYLRLHSAHTSAPGWRFRNERLAYETQRGRAVLELDVGPGPSGPWAPLVTVSLDRLAKIDGEALRFRPFRTGRGVRPQGFVHALRVGAYSLSQRARPEHRADYSR